MRIDHGANIAAEHGVKRSEHWPKVEKAFRAAHPRCLIGSETTGLQVHHIHPFHVCIGVGRPDMELDPRNLVVLCETEENLPEQNHHLIWGHFGNFKDWNEEVSALADEFTGYPGIQLENDPMYITLKAEPRKMFADWTQAEKDAYKVMLDHNYPPDPEILALIKGVKS